MGKGNELAIHSGGNQKTIDTDKAFNLAGTQEGAN